MAFISNIEIENIESGGCVGFTQLIFVESEIRSFRVVDIADSRSKIESIKKAL